MTQTPRGRGNLPGRVAQPVRSRRSRRRLLLAWSAPVALIVLALAVRMVGMTIVNDHAIDAFGNGRYGPSSTGFERLQTANVLERWVAPFNRGDSLYEQKRYGQAAEEFRRALGLASADRSCMVRVNLVLTIESIGDAKLAAKSLQDAVHSYQSALSIVDAASCPLGTTQHTGEQLAQAYAEIVAKLKALDAKPQPKPSQTNPKQPQPQPPPDNKGSKLQERNDRAQRADRQHQDQDKQGHTEFHERW
ncbi:MAG: tetratricopeptide repeat protein [Mycobacteriales bacterium]